MLRYSQLTGAQYYSPVVFYANRAADSTAGRDACKIAVKPYANVLEIIEMLKASALKINEMGLKISSYRPSFEVKDYGCYPLFF